MTISDLPPDVLGENFYHCSKLWPDAPLTLSRVSRSFYSATVTTARAWTYLQLLSSSDDTDMERRCGRKAELWFSHAGATPLHIVVDIPCLDPQSMVSPFSEHRLVFSSLPLVLRRQAHRINSLTLHAPTFETVHHFLTATYGMNTTPNSVNPNDAPCLRNLTLDIVRETRRGAATHTTSYSESPNPEKPLASSSHFTSLQHLEITNHALPYLLYMIDMSEMRTLVITGPLRAAPLAPSLVLDILRRATRLNRLEFESRLLPDKTYLELLSPMHSEDQTNQVECASGQSGTTSIIPIRGVIALKELTHLSIRTNNIPALLAYLVLPQLQTLSIEDLDGRRPNAAHETGLVLFHLLVRMDVQCDEKAMGVGLKELDLADVNLRDTASTRKSIDVSIAAREGTMTTEPDDPHLRWCLRKMKVLQRIRAKNINIEALFGLLSQGSTSTATDLVPCPNLKTVCLLTTHAPLSLLADFQERRRDVSVVIQGGQNGEHRLLHQEGRVTNAGSPCRLHKIEVDEGVAEGRASVVSNHLEGFGFGSSFDRSRRIEFKTCDAVQQLL